MSLPEAVIADMDGTLCAVAGIRHLLHGPGRFDAFHRESVNCPPNQWVIDEVQRHHEAGRAVLIVTARQARYRNLTAFWLAMPSDHDEALTLALDNPMPATLREQIANWIEPYTMNVGAEHDDAMTCIGIAFPLIRAHLAAEAGASS